MSPFASSLGRDQPLPPAQPPAGLISHRLARGVSLLLQNGTARLLDLEHGRFFALNATGTRLLTLALEVAAEEAVCRVACEEHVEEEHVRAGWAQLARECAAGAC